MTSPTTNVVIFALLALLCASLLSSSAAGSLSDFAGRHAARSYLRPTPPAAPIDTAQQQPQLRAIPSLVRQREEQQLLRAGRSIAQPASPAPAQYFTQRLDHFDRSVHAMWQQKYYVNDSLWNGTGPVLFLFGHERDMSADLVAGTWVINWLAEHFGGLIVCLEHRFYGESWPTNDTSIGFLTRYLSTEQALEDAAVWTSHIKQQYNVSDSSKWVVLGRSYGGTLAALFRLKFPHLVTGAFATSGPLQAKVDFPEYNEVVEIALGHTCASKLRQANDKVTALLSNATGQAQLAKDFGFCAPLTSRHQHAMLVDSWAGEIDDTVQYSVGNQTQVLCDTFLAAGGGDPYKALIELYFPPRSECRPALNYTRYVEESKRDVKGLSWPWQVDADITSKGYAHAAPPLIRHLHPLSLSAPVLCAMRADVQRVRLVPDQQQHSSALLPPARRQLRLGLLP